MEEKYEFDDALTDQVLDFIKGHEAALNMLSMVNLMLRKASVQLKFDYVLGTEDRKLKLYTIGDDEDTLAKLRLTDEAMKELETVFNVKLGRNV
jgi:hypothetical protein